MVGSFWPPRSRRRLLALALPAGFFACEGALAEELASLPAITVTAERVEQPVAQTGSSVTIVPREEVEKHGAKSVADILRDVAGVNVAESGGLGSATEVRLRGANPGETLVLIDGVRVGDPAAVDSSLDFGNLSANNIERVEVLRGPQSALYGSDAMGGVINIITRKGDSQPRREVSIEAGSYGTLSTHGFVSGAVGDLAYALGASVTHSDGFPRYGYRVSRPIVIGDGVTPLPPAPGGDATNKGGVGGSFSYRLSDRASIDAGFNANGNALRFDNPFATMPANVFNSANHSNAFVADGFVRANVGLFDGALTNHLTVFGNATNRDAWELEGCFDSFFNSFFCRSGYRGSRLGAEYQGVAKLGAVGGLVFGLRNDTESATTSQSPDPGDGSFNAIDKRQTTNSAFAEFRGALFERLDLTLGGRIDSIENGQTFDTWRATAAWRVEETGTKLRASGGTGAKAPTLFQRFSIFGTTALLPEQSVGFDVGVDQTLFKGRLVASLGYFDNRYANLVAFATVPGCSAAALAAAGGCYYNVGKAETKGVEVSLDAVLAPGAWRARAAYTYLDARDLNAAGPADPDAQRPLYRQPHNLVVASLVFSGVPNLEIEPRFTWVDQRLDLNFPTPVTLKSYGKLDMRANYKVDDHLSVFARLENINDARYEEVYNFGTAGRSVYAGLKYVW